MSFENQAIRGVYNHYGPRKIEQKFGGETDNSVIKTVSWIFDYDNLPDASTNGLDYQIPANATIVSAKLQIITPFTSTSTTTDLAVGLQKADGTAIDDDGLITALQATQTAIAVAGAIVDGASGTPAALVGKSIGTSDGELVVIPTVADLTAGKARMIIEYIKQGM